MTNIIYINIKIYETFTLVMISTVTQDIHRRVNIVTNNLNMKIQTHILFCADMIS